MLVRRLLVYGFWAALFFALTMALLPKPPQLPGNPGDKVQHIAAFAVLTALSCAAYPVASAVRIGVGLGAFGLMIEVLQMIPILHRDGSALDWTADMGAVLIVLLLTSWLRKLKQSNG
jgi:hypothetical protein